jgi:hypothetical protein
MSPFGTPGAPWQTAQCAAKCSVPISNFAGSSSPGGTSAILELSYPRGLAMIAQDLPQLEGWDEWAEDMVFAVPQYSRKRVNEAGDALIRLHELPTHGAREKLKSTLKLTT